MDSFHVWLLKPEGTATWIGNDMPGAKASEALLACRAKHPSYTPFDRVYIVLRPNSNPNGDQVLWRLVSDTEVQPAGLESKVLSVVDLLPTGNEIVDLGD